MSKDAYSFITGSKYSGHMIESLHSMNGFGVYIYPQETARYRGFFKDGKFHGYGCVKIMKPEQFELRGQFENGAMVSIDDITFADGLHVKCNHKAGEQLVFDSWVYCCNNDRRYSTELSVGLDPVGQNSFVTRLKPPRQLPKNCYDTEEGIYHCRTGFITQIPEPFSPCRFVHSQTEVDWIKRNCRKSVLKSDLNADVEPKAIELDAEFCRKILDSNMDSLAHLKVKCECYWNTQEQNLSDLLRHGAHGDAKVLLMTDDSDGCTSFSDVSLTQNLEEIIRNNRRILHSIEISTFSSRNKSLIQQRQSMVLNNQM